MHAMHEYQAKKINYYKWEALINLLREKERKKHVGEKKENKKIVSNTVYQRIELT